MASAEMGRSDGGVCTVARERVSTERNLVLSVFRRGDGVVILPH